MHYFICTGELLYPYGSYPSKEEADHCAELLRIERPDKHIEVMNGDQWDRWLKKKVLTPAKQISEQVWDYHLEVLPPVNWFPRKKPETFMMSEHLIGPYTEMYGRLGDIYISKTVDRYDESTWITEKDFKNLKPLKDLITALGGEKIA